MAEPTAPHRSERALTRGATMHRVVVDERAGTCHRVLPLPRKTLSSPWGRAFTQSESTTTPSEICHRVRRPVKHPEAKVPQRIRLR